jgi:hypothetical protein
MYFSWVQEAMANGIQDGDRDRAANLMSSWPRDPAEKLEIHLNEVKHQGEPKTRHSKHLVEGYSMPWCNKRTAGLPNPHSIGLQSHCSILLGSPSLGLCQATALCQTHTWRDTLRSPALLATQPLGSLPPIHAGPQPGAGPIVHRDTSLLSPLPSGPCWAPGMCGMTRPPPLRLGSPIRPCWAPALCGMIGDERCWDRHQPGVR